MTPAERVARNVEAARTVTEVACPHCGQPAGATCVTTGLNEAAFPHAKRLALRLSELAT